MLFANSGAQALVELDSGPIDVIVTDMRMPEMDGAAVLAEAAKRQPDAVRFVLSGYAETEGVLRAVPIAHQFLTKPCEPGEVRRVVERACELRALLRSDAIRDVVGRVRALPTRPTIYAQLTQAIADPDTSLRQLVAIVESDIAICAKLLQLVNSSFVGVRQRVTSIDRALTLIGTSMLKSLVLSQEVFRCFALAGRCLSLDEEHRHAMVTGAIARAMFSDKQTSEDAFMAGMLHDVGKLVLAQHCPDAFSAALAAADRTERSRAECEREALGVSHSELGAYLLGIWGLPYPVVEAVARHHEPVMREDAEFDLVAAVYIASQLAEEQLKPGQDTLDVAYCERLGVMDKIPDWRAVAESAALS